MVCNDLGEDPSSDTLSPSECRTDKGEAAFGLEWGLHLGRYGSSEGGLHMAPTHLRRVLCHHPGSPALPVLRQAAVGVAAITDFASSLPPPPPMVLENWKEAHKSKGP